MTKTVAAKRNVKNYQGFNQQGAVSFGGRTTVFFRTLTRSLNTFRKAEYGDGRSRTTLSFG